MGSTGVPAPIPRLGYGFHRCSGTNPKAGVWVPPVSRQVFGVFGVFGVFFLDQLDFKEGAELRSWLRSTEIEERVQADTLEVMFLKR